MAQKYDDIKRDLLAFKKQNPKLSHDALIEKWLRTKGDIPYYLMPKIPTLRRWLNA